MSMRAIVAWGLVGTLGCTSVLGVDFDNRAFDDDPHRCVPQQEVRCACVGRVDLGWRSCDANGTPGACRCTGSDAAVPDAPSPTATSAPTGMPPYGNGGDAGDSDASVAALCGNGVLEVGEACDPGQQTEGCSSTCQPTGRSAASRMCPGQRLNLWRARPILATLNGVSAETRDGGADETCQDVRGDRVFEVVPRESGTLRVSYNSRPGLGVSLRSACTTQAAADVCRPPSEDGAWEIDYPATIGRPVFVVLFADRSFGLGYTLQMTLR